MMGPSQYAGITQSAIGAGQAIGGMVRSSRAKKEYKNLGEGPNYDESRGYLFGQNTLNLAERRAQQGLAQESMNFQTDMIGRDTAAVLNSAGNLRGGLAGIGSVAQGMGDRYRKLGMDDALMRDKNQIAYMNQRNLWADEERYNFENEVGQFVNKRSEILGRMASGQAQTTAGLNMVSEGASTFGGGGGGGIASKMGSF